MPRRLAATIIRVSTVIKVLRLFQKRLVLSLAMAELSKGIIAAPIAPPTSIW